MGDRKDAEKALNEKKERIRKAKEAREAAAKEAAENPQQEDMGDMGGMGGLGGLFNDPEMMAAFADPEVLHNSELAFFTDYLLSMGAILPPKPEPKQEQKQKEPSPAAPPQSKEEDMEVESEESDVELDMEGVVKNPDPEEAHEMGDPEKKEMTDDEMEKFDEKRGEAMSAFSEGEWEAAIALFTEAIQLNPNSAAMFAKRGACFIKVQKPNACVRDCTRAIELNPDNAGAYKFRG